MTAVGHEAWKNAETVLDTFVCTLFVPPIMYRKLRLTWSFGCGVLCLLLFALWMRSFWWTDSLDYPHGITGASAVTSVHGVLIIGTGKRDNNNQSLEPAKWSTPISEWQEGFGGLPEPFQLNVANKSVFVVVPHLVLILLTGAFGVLPLMRWRFSLRNLLIATTLVAVVLGLVMYISHKTN